MSDFLSPIKPRPARRVAWRLWRERRGATAVEYGLIMALIFLVMCASVRGVGNVTAGMWGNVSSKIGNATGN